jgi:hypothetical protein
MRTKLRRWGSRSRHYVSEVAIVSRGSGAVPQTFQIADVPPDFSSNGVPRAATGLCRHAAKRLKPSDNLTPAASRLHHRLLAAFAEVDRHGRCAKLSARKSSMAATLGNRCRSCGYIASIESRSGEWKFSRTFTSLPSRSALATTNSLRRAIPSPDRANR